MSRLDTFVAPRPKKWLIRAMVPVNRVIMLKGTLGLRGVCDIPAIDFPADDATRLAAACGQGRATFVTPNHPEFFTDWMLDKELSARLFPEAAFWATNGIVNGLGRTAQSFWLANNLIAQIPGNSDSAREFSIGWAVRGKGVLLHPEGMVGWHSNHVALLMPGAVEMALEALRRGRETSPGFQAFVAPVVWKLVFQRDVEAGLLAECAYVEHRLGIEPGEGMTLPGRVYRLYETLIGRDERRLGMEPAATQALVERHRRLVHALCALIADMLDLDPQREPSDMLRLARRRGREAKDAPNAKEIRSVIDVLALNLRLGSFAFESGTTTQEELAEHIKRIRNDYCKGTTRDTMNRYVPRPVGPRTAIIRVPQPLAMHDFSGTTGDAVTLLRGRMQDALDTINGTLLAEGRLRTYPNPFHAA